MSFVNNFPFGYAYCLAYDSVRNLVFAGSGGGVFVVDITDPQDMKIISDKIRTRGIVENLYYDLYKKVLFVADGPFGLEVWDVNDPTFPNKLSFFPMEDFCYDVTGKENVVFAAAQNKVLAIDVSNLYSPFLIDSVALGSNSMALSLSLHSDYVYVAADSGGFYVLKYFNNELHIVGHLDLSAPVSEVKAFKNNDTYVALIPADSCINIVDVENPAEPFRVSILHMPEEDALPLSEIIQMPFLYVSYVDRFSWREGIYVVEISDPSNPSILSTWEERSFSIPFDMEISQDLVLLSNFDKLLQVVDVSNPDSLFSLGWIYGGGFSDHIYSYKHYLFLEGWRLRTDLIDMYELVDPGEVIPPNHEEIRQSYSGSYPSHLFNHYYFQYEYAVSITDITDPRLRFPVASFYLPHPPETYEYPRPIVATQNFLYIASYFQDSHIFIDALFVMDITDPFTPYMVSENDGFYTGPDDALVENKGFLYVIGQFSFSVYDIRDPTSLHFVRSIPFESTPQKRRGYLFGDYLFVTQGNSLMIFNVSIPENPYQVSSLPFPGAMDVVVSGDYAYVADSFGVHVVNIKDPTSPEVKGYYITPAPARGVEVLEPFVFVSCGIAGIQVYRFTGEVKKSLNSYRKGSFVTLKKDRLELDWKRLRGEDIDIFDITGRRIMSVHSMAQGSMDIKNLLGLPTGLYFIRVLEKNKVHIEKIIFVK